MKSVVLKPGECREYSDTISQYLEKALQYSTGERTKEQILDQSYQGLVQCWVVFNDNQIVNLTTTEVLDYPNKRVLHIITSTGNDWEGHKQEHDELVQFAKSTDCSSITVYGRKGWERKLPVLGYEHVYSVFEYEIKGD